MELKEFGYNNHLVRTIEIDNEVWFVGKDVAEALEYRNTRDALAKHVDDEDKKILTSQSATFENMPNRGLTIINESGVYALIFGSKLESAKEFKRWVTKEVLPELRKQSGLQGFEVFRMLNEVRNCRWN